MKLQICNLTLADASSAVAVHLKACIKLGNFLTPPLHQKIDAGRASRCPYSSEQIYIMSGFVFFYVFFVVKSLLTFYPQSLGQLRQASLQLRADASLETGCHDSSYKYNLRHTLYILYIYFFLYLLYSLLFIFFSFVYL